MGSRQVSQVNGEMVVQVQVGVKWQEDCHTLAHGTEHIGNPLSLTLTLGKIEEVQSFCLSLNFAKFYPTHLLTYIFIAVAFVF